jgi:hypothetical protein
MRIMDLNTTPTCLAFSEEKSAELVLITRKGFSEFSAGLMSVWFKANQITISFQDFEEFTSNCRVRNDGMWI